MRIIWVLAIMAAAAGAFYEIGMVVKDYISSPLLTVYERKAEIKLEFPIIQICPSHFINKSRVYADTTLHPSVVDEYLSYFNSPVETTFTNYTADAMEKSAILRDFNDLPLAYTVVTSKTQSEALSVLKKKLEKHPEFKTVADGTSLFKLYKVGFYEAKRRAEEADCMRINSDHAIEGHPCSAHFYDKMRRKRAASEGTCPSCGDFTGVRVKRAAALNVDDFTDVTDVAGFSDPTADEHLALVAGYVDPPEDLEAFVDTINMDMNQMLVGCNWRAKYRECEELARSTFDAKRGQCFTLDKDYGRVQISEGMGLIVVIDMKRETQWTFHPEISAGVNVRIMDNFDPVTVGDLWAPIGSITKIDLRSTKYLFHTNPKYEACHADIERKILNSPYSDSLCRAECLMQEQMKKCDCIQIVPGTFLKDTSIRQCREYEDRLCLNKFMQNEEWVDLVADCFANCRPACSYWEHGPIVTYSAFPSKVYLDYVANSAPDIAARLDNYLLLDISYARLQIKQDISITIDGFLSQIGGHLGLFLGSSVLSLCQLMIFCVNVICCARNKKVEPEPRIAFGEEPIQKVRLPSPGQIYHG